MLLKGSGFCASWCGTPGSVVACWGKCHTRHFQHEHHWEQRAPRERHPWSSLWHLCPFCHSITGYTSVCALAFTQTQEQTRFSEAAANPGLGSKHSSPSWERSLGGIQQKKTVQGRFSHDVTAEIHFSHHLAFEFGETCRRKSLRSPSILQMCIPFYFF